MNLLTDWLVYKFEWAEILYPFSYFFYFLVYPFTYLYTKSLVDEDSNKIFLTNRKYFAFPVLILVLISALYYPLSFEEKKQFLDLKLDWTGYSFSAKSSIEIIIISGYYIQTFFYIVLFILLVKNLKKKINPQESKLLIAKYILILAIGIIFFEIVFICISVLVKDLIILKIVEFLTLVCFIIFGFYIAINQTIIRIQTKMAIQIPHLLDTNETSDVKAPINEENIQELSIIKDLILNYISTTKIFLDPNLSIDIFSKKIHIQSRKISVVINRLFGKNFHNFINEFRINEALKIIESERLVIIEEIYTKVGFNSRSTFNRAFKEVTGLTPSEYIENKESA